MDTDKKQKVLIVGGVAGGASAAARLRRLDEKAEIIMFEKGDYISFANCGLPYYIGGVIPDRQDLLLQTPQSFKARFNVDVRVRSTVTAIDPEQKTVTVLCDGKTTEESYDKLILSPGALPLRPPIPGLEMDRVFTVRNIPDTVAVKQFIDENNPREAVVIGAGFIGLEVAENLERLGIDVKIIEAADQILPPVDPETARMAQEYLNDQGITIHLNSAVTMVTPDGSQLSVRTPGHEFSADFVILSIGVRPDSDIAEKAGLAVNEKGAIRVDERMLTSDPDIYAIGDAVENFDFTTGQPVYSPLAGPANKQGRQVAGDICGLPFANTGTQGSAVVKLMYMTVAATGINEKTARRLGLDYGVSYTFSPSHATYYPGAEQMMIKTIYENGSGKILGAQISGLSKVDKRVQVFATAIRAGMTADDLTRIDLTYAPPYGSAKDPVNMAGYVVQNILNGLVRTIQYQDVIRLPRNGSVQLIDVRNPGEYEKGHIPDFINIPLDSIRDRMDEIDKDKPVYVTCQVGLRGYLAARILMQNGYDVWNLSGGYRIYKLMEG